LFSCDGRGCFNTDPGNPNPNPGEVNLFELNNDDIQENQTLNQNADPLLVANEDLIMKVIEVNKIENTISSSSSVITNKKSSQDVLVADNTVIPAHQNSSQDVLIVDNIVTLAHQNSNQDILIADNTVIPVHQNSKQNILIADEVQAENYVSSNPNQTKRTFKSIT
jgi:hypothetical protein